MVVGVGNPYDHGNCVTSRIVTNNVTDSDTARTEAIGDVTVACAR